MERSDALESSELIERQADRSRNVRTIAVFAGAFALGVTIASFLFNQSDWGWQLLWVVVAFLLSAVIALLQWHSTAPLVAKAGQLTGDREMEGREPEHVLLASARSLLREMYDYVAPLWSWPRSR